MPNKNGSNWIRPEKRLAIYIRDNFRCVYCDKDLSKVKRSLRGLDHVMPRSQGGSNDSSNLVLCCKRCNDRKQDKPLAIFMQHNDHKLAHILEQMIKPLDVAYAKAVLSGVIEAINTPQE